MPSGIEKNHGDLDTKTPSKKKTRMEAVAQDTEEAAAKEETTPPQPQGLNLNELRVAYVVGLTPEGNFVFEVAGKEKGLVELLGLHQYACKRVEALTSEVLGTGDKLTSEVGKALVQLSQKVDQLLKLSSPPQNKL